MEVWKSGGDWPHTSDSAHGHSLIMPTLRLHWGILRRVSFCQPGGIQNVGFSNAPRSVLTESFGMPGLESYSYMDRTPATATASTSPLLDAQPSSVLPRSGRHRHS